VVECGRVKGVAAGRREEGEGEGERTGDGAALGIALP